jgi:hypothetical protein
VSWWDRLGLLLVGGAMLTGYPELACLLGLARLMYGLPGEEPA